VKQNVSPAVIVSVLAVLVLVLGVLVFRPMNAPSSVAAPASERGRAKNPYAGGGPTEADLKKMREYNAAHPGARSNYR